MMLILEKVSGGYSSGNFVLNGIDLNFHENEVVSIVGQNGSGKSTLAKAILNLIPYRTGKILFNGKNLNRKTTTQIVKMGINYFIQGGRIFPNLTIMENVDFAYHNLDKDKDIRRKLRILTYFDLFNRAQKDMKMMASFLSKGEQHQLALAMVLLQKPKLLILDEPSAGLSPGNVKNIFSLLKTIKKEEQINILLIEQNIHAAINLSDRIVLLQNGSIVNEERCEQLRDIDKIDKFFFRNL